MMARAAREEGRRRGRGPWRRVYVVLFYSRSYPCAGLSGSDGDVVMPSGDS